MIARMSLVSIAFLVSSVSTSALAAAPGPGGYLVDESSCGSGGPTTYFFTDGTVFRDGCGDDCPNLRVGTWKKRPDGTIALTFKRAYVGRGSEPMPGPTPAQTVFKSYSGKVEDISETDTFHWTGVTEEDGSCEVVRTNGMKPDPHVLLRVPLGRDFTSERAVTDEDLAGLGAEELEILRNEIYARYGHAFKNKRLAAHFAKDPSYAARLDNVSAFLSPLERDNVAKILAAEKALKKKK
ncbi:MAG: YARHG domain-containing protein [Deltaproteobacteria bacterium]|nr:MAG: YARHG domain-containing protein [Deltaproteobacteria bacterium]